MAEEKKTQGRKTAEELATKQRDISIAEFFEKNRHLLGFDNPRKALLTTIKEAVDNALDACEEARILPEVMVEVADMGDNRFKIVVEDNGPGIIKEQIPKIFAKLLYGSKFHSLKQSRGQQGIGISAAVMYAQLTTGRPAKITSKTAADKPAHYYELFINKQTNSPDIIKDEIKEWRKERGTRIEVDLEANYLKGGQSVDEYLKQTAIINPHVTIIYVNPKGEQHIFARATDELPPEPREVKPHPHGLEFGMLQNLLKTTPSKTLQQFLTTDLSRVGPQLAKELCDTALIDPKTKPDKVTHADVEKLIAAIKNAKIMAPSSDSISPIGADNIEKGIRKEINAEFFCSITRTPAVYRGNPFQIEVGIAYGGDQPGDKSANLIRFANRVPLLYQQGACATTKSIVGTNWKAYGLNQSAGQLPVGPITILIHIASVWVPFTSESKEAIAHYPEIIKELKLGLQEAGRKLQTYVQKKKRVGAELQKRGYIEQYIPTVAESLVSLVELKKEDQHKIEEHLKDILEKHRGELEDMEFDESKNTEYDKGLAKIGNKRHVDLDDDTEDGEESAEEGEDE